MPSDLASRETVVRYVLDTSCVIAVLQKENGAETVEAVIQHSVISSVSYAETLSKASDKGFPIDLLVGLMEEWGLEIIPFTQEVAIVSAQIRRQTKGKPRSDNVSLADRACLATAKHYNLIALTGDRPWKDLGLDIQLEFIR